MISTVFLISAVVTDQHCPLHISNASHQKSYVREEQLSFFGLPHVFTNLFPDEDKNQYKISHIYYSVKLSVVF